MPRRCKGGRCARNAAWQEWHFLRRLMADGMFSVSPRSLSVCAPFLLGRTAAAGLAQRQRSRPAGLALRRGPAATNPRRACCASSAGPRRVPRAEHSIDEDAPFERDGQHVARLDHDRTACIALSRLMRTRPACTSFAASDRDFTTRAKNSHLSMRWRSSRPSYFFSWSRSAASLAKGESGSNRTAAPRAAWSGRPAWP